MDFKLRNDADRAIIMDYLKKMQIEPREYEVTIKRKATKRTLPQNRLYYLWLNCISAETGNEVEDLHEYFKTKFLGVRYRIIYGEGITTPFTTTDLDTEQFKEYLDKVQRWANTEQGIILPNPEDLGWAQFVEEYSKNL